LDTKMGRPNILTMKMCYSETRLGLQTSSAHTKIRASSYWVEFMVKL
jgi:hypothetical protein